MPMPATTGKLCTSIDEMDIGDYIICNYTASSDIVGTFSNFGGMVGTEIPIIGTATPNGYFYFIKVAKGLLISDRIVQNQITWDNLNNGKVIQGFHWFENIIPIMTSNTTPMGVASDHANSTDAWKAFDRSYASSSAQDSWGAIGGIGWVAYEFTEPKKIKGYAIQNFNNGQYYIPKNWTFEGWDGSQWIVLDTQTNQTNWSSYEKRIFLIDNDREFIKYRISVNGNNGASNGNAIIGDIEMYETVGIIRSLTGGVAYADVNGNKSLKFLDKSYGCYPVNNEYDKYINNFPTELIQEGKSIDDIFHCKNIWTWTQDSAVIQTVTSSSGTTYTANSSHRVLRGNELAYEGIWGDQSFSPSNNAGDSFGFRPVFEYKEV